MNQLSTKQLLDYVLYRRIEKKKPEYPSWVPEACVIFLEKYIQNKPLLEHETITMLTYMVDYAERFLDTEDYKEFVSNLENGILPLEILNVMDYLLLRGVDPF